MPYIAACACLGWVATTCALLWLFDRRDKRTQTEHKLHREEIASAARALLEQVQAHQAQIAALNESHRQEIAQLNQARIEEVAGLLQRIQAPQAAVAEHAGRGATADPPPFDLEDDAELLAEAKRQMDQFEADLEARVH